MRWILITVMVAMALAWGALATGAKANAVSQDPATMAAEPSRPAVTVTSDGDAWTAEYELDRDAAVWAFFRSALIEETGDASLRRDVETLLDRGSDDPDAVIAGLFDRSGVAYRRDGDKVRLN